MKRGRLHWVKECYLVYSNGESLAAPEEVYPTEFRDEMLIEILKKNVCVLQRSTIGKDINTLSINNFFFLAKPHKPAFHSQGANKSAVFFS